MLRASEVLHYAGTADLSSFGEHYVSDTREVQSALGVVIRRKGQCVREPDRQRCSSC